MRYCLLLHVFTTLDFSVILDGQCIVNEYVTNSFIEPTNTLAYCFVNSESLFLPAKSGAGVAQSV
jgi:hypothetical protein